MSGNTKDNKKLSAAKERELRAAKKEKTLKAVIIAAIAIAAAAIIAVIAVYVIKPAVQKRAEEKAKDNAASSAVNSQDTGKKDVYNGCTMPADIAAILKDGDAESAEACREYGAAMKLDEREISVPEYSFYYYRETIDKFVSVVTSVQEKGGNYTGFDPAKKPSEQKNQQEKTQWSEKFKGNLLETIKKQYALFDAAIAANFYPDASVFDELTGEYEYLKEYAERNGTLDEFIESNYVKGFTFNMFFRNEIIKSYAAAYEEHLQKTAYESYSQDEINAQFDADPRMGKQVNIRIYPIIYNDNLEEAKTVKTLDSFFAFAKKDQRTPGYDPEIATDAYLVTYSDITSTFGGNVADWVFSPDRKQGEFGIAKGQYYSCLIYMEELPKVTNAKDVLVLRYDADEVTTVEQQRELIDSEYEDLKKEGITQEKFTNYLINSGADPEIRTVYANTFGKELDKWIQSPERKNGDVMTWDDGTTSAYMVMFVSDNPGELYWNMLFRLNRAKEDAAAEINDLITGIGKINPDDSGVNKAIELAETRYIQFYEKNKESAGLSNK